MSDNAAPATDISDFDHAVVVFTKPNCVQCDATQRKLQRAGIDYQAVDLTENPDLINQLREMGFASAPVVKQPDGQMYSGYNPERIKSIISAMTPPAGAFTHPHEGYQHSTNPTYSPQSGQTLGQ